MSELTRLSISLEKKLFEKLDRLVAHSGYANRSEYIRDVIREQLVQQEWQRGRGEVVATVTLIYDHHARGLNDRLTRIQHGYHKAILATTHVHLDDDLCAEMIMMKERAESIRRLADRLRQQKGVLHATLSFSSTGRSLR